MTPPDPLDALLAVVTPAALLQHPAATGEGVAVAVVDSGVDRAVVAARHPQAIPIEGAVFAPAFAPYHGTASAPHGTTVADVLLAVAPRARVYSADVFGAEGSSDVEHVAAAVRHAVEVWQVRIVNLSLGVPEHKLQQLPKRNLLRRAIEEAYYAGVAVFAAAHNDHPLTLSYPAAFGTPLVAVDKGLFADPLLAEYRPHDRAEFAAHGRGYLGPFAQEPATSWATPHLAGIAARLLSLRPTLLPFELKALLYWMFRPKAVG